MAIIRPQFHVLNKFLSQICLIFIVRNFFFVCVLWHYWKYTLHYVLDIWRRHTTNSNWIHNLKVRRAEMFNNPPEMRYFVGALFLVLFVNRKTKTYVWTEFESTYYIFILSHIPICGDCLRCNVRLYEPTNWRSGKSAADKSFRQNLETKQTAVFSRPEGHVDTSRS